MIIMAAIIILNLTSCKSGKSDGMAQENKEKFDINIAINIVNTYMEYMLSGDIENAKELYSKELAEKSIEPYPTDLKILGYKIFDIKEIGRSGVFNLKVVRGAPNKVISTLDYYHVKVELTENEYKIAEIATDTEKEAFLEGEGLRVKDKNKVKTNLIVDMSGIPYYAFPKNDAAMINKAPVPKESFGMISFNYNGERLAVTTKDEKDTYISIVEIDETITSPEGNGGGGGASEGSGNGNGGGNVGGDGAGGSKLIIKEPPIGKGITSLDILQNATVENLMFSLEEEVVMAQYKVEGKGTTMRVYDVESGDLVDFNFQEKFPIDKVDVTFSSFTKSALNFEVKEKGEAGKEDAELLGKWQLDLKKFQVKKL